MLVHADYTNTYWVKCYYEGRFKIAESIM